MTVEHEPRPLFAERNLALWRAPESRPDWRRLDAWGRYDTVASLVFPVYGESTDGRA